MLTLVGLAQLWVNPALSGRPQCPLALGQTYCDASTLRGFDRSVVGRSSKNWLRVSDVGMLLGIAAPVLGAVGEGLPHLRRGKVAAWEALQLDLTVSLEAMSVATFLNTVVKYAVRRPRPGNYSAPLQSAQGQLSFPSGHTAAAAAGLTTLTSTFWLRHPTSPWRFGLAGLTLGLTAVTGYGRVAGGMHFYSDILAGAVLGGATGYLLPQLYRRDVALQPLQDPQGGVCGVSLTAPL
jgi:membrane-associated phospholipid phosphatase